MESLVCGAENNIRAAVARVVQFLCAALLDPVVQWKVCRAWLSTFRTKTWEIGPAYEEQTLFPQTCVDFVRAHSRNATHGGAPCDNSWSDEDCEMFRRTAHILEVFRTIMYGKPSLSIRCIQNGAHLTIIRVYLFDRAEGASHGYAVECEDLSDECKASIIALLVGNARLFGLWIQPQPEDITPSHVYREFFYDDMLAAEFPRAPFVQCCTGILLAGGVLMGCTDRAATLVVTALNRVLLEMVRAHASSGMPPDTHAVFEEARRIRFFITTDPKFTRELCVLRRFYGCDEKTILPGP